MGLRDTAILDRAYESQVREWVKRREAMGWRLVSKVAAPYMTPCVDWREEPGTMWVVVSARFYFDGNQGTLTGDDMQEMRETMLAMGAEKSKGSAGVAKYLEAMTPEQAAAAVQAAKPRKEYDDDPI